MIYHVALDMACKELSERTGTCPLDCYDVQPRDCANECESQIQDCWKKYFLKIIDDRRK